MIEKAVNIPSSTNAERKMKVNEPNKGSGRGKFKG